MGMKSQGVSARAIASQLGRSPSTITRELRRNGHRSPQERGPMGRPTIAGGYDARRAGRLWSVVHQHLELGWSPEQIAGTLGSVSHETIYTAIYAMPCGSLRRELTMLLRQGRAKRRPHSRGTERRGKMKDFLSIHVSPPEADDRLLPGHWEGDFIKGAGNHSAVGTLVDRKTLFVMIAKMDNCSALAALEGFSAAFAPLDPELRKTLTYDQGKEMALHAQRTERTGMAIYFAELSPQESDKDLRPSALIVD